jgi:hypothetical protein
MIGSLNGFIVNHTAGRAAPENDSLGKRRLMVEQRTKSGLYGSSVLAKADRGLGPVTRKETMQKSLTSKQTTEAPGKCVAAIYHWPTTWVTK